MEQFSWNTIIDNVFCQKSNSCNGEMIGIQKELYISVIIAAEIHGTNVRVEIKVECIFFVFNHLHQFFGCFEMKFLILLCHRCLNVASIEIVLISLKSIKNFDIFNEKKKKFYIFIKWSDWRTINIPSMKPRYIIHQNYFFYYFFKKREFVTNFWMFGWKKKTHRQQSIYCSFNAGKFFVKRMTKREKYNINLRKKKCHTAHELIIIR